MEHSELFLLLPVYEDILGQPYYIKRTSVMTEDEILKIIENIDGICNFIKNENYQGYYDADNVRAFLYPTTIVTDCYPNVVTRMRLVMSKWGENWRTQKIQKATERYMYHDLQIKDDTLCEMAERKTVSANVCSFLLVNHNALSCRIETIKPQRNQVEVELDVRNADIKSISEWYTTNRKPQRIFNLNPKHGENGKGAHPEHDGEKVSTLMCGREEAYDMLLRAIGIDQKVLYFFDRTRKKFIEFRREYNNTYHGFHLDCEDEKRVPQKIKAIISKLMS